LALLELTDVFGVLGGDHADLVSPARPHYLFRLEVTLELRDCSKGAISLLHHFARPLNFRGVLFHHETPDVVADALEVVVYFVLDFNEL